MPAKAFGLGLADAVICFQDTRLLREHLGGYFMADPKLTVGTGLIMSIYHLLEVLWRAVHINVPWPGMTY
jgi:hypothetical protein